MKKLILINILIFSFYGFSLNAKTNLFNIKSLHGDIDLSALYSMWSPNLQSETLDVNFIKYNSLGETSLNIKGHLEYAEHSIFKIDYIIPLKNTPEMKEIIEYNNKKEKGIEELKFYFIIDPIMNKILSGNKLKYFRFLTNIKFNYQRKRYITNAVNNSEFYYIPESAKFNPITDYIEGNEYILPETNMTWNSEIISKEITLKIIETDYIKVSKFLKIYVSGPFKLNIVPIQLRIGYFTLEQIQPSAGLFTYDEGIPTIMDAKFTSDGIVFNLVTINEEEPGLNMDCKFRGYSNWFKGTSLDSAAFDLFKDHFESDAYPAFMSLGFNFWYNVRFNSKCLLTLGSNFDIDAFFIYAPKDSDKSEEEDNSDEMVWRLRQFPMDLYFRFGYRF